jgi:hypothetical protein
VKSNEEFGRFGQEVIRLSNSEKLAKTAQLLPVVDRLIHELSNDDLTSDTMFWQVFVMLVMVLHCINQ